MVHFCISRSRLALKDGRRGWFCQKKGGSEPSRPSFPVQQNKRHTQKKGRRVQNLHNSGGATGNFVRKGGKFAASPALGNQVISGGKYYPAYGNSI